jgi:hypothetical protein
MKLAALLSTVLVLASGVAMAEHHEVCMKDGAKIEAKDKADCESKGGKMEEMKK